MSTYKDCQNLINNFSNIKMDTRDDTVGDACLSPSNASPPDFDFNLPCRFFKSSFARSLSLNNANNNGSNNQCKSLDYDMRSNKINNSSNKLSCLKRDMTAVSAVPPLPQRRLNQAESFYQQNEANTSEQKHVYADTNIETVFNEEEKPPALPARRPLSLHNLPLPQNLSVNECQLNAEQKYQQNILTQLTQQAYKQSTNIANNNSIMPVNGNNNTHTDYNDKSYIDHTTGLQLSPQQNQPTLNHKPQPHHFTASSYKPASSNSCNSSNVNNNNSSSSKNNFRRNNNNNHIVWPNQQKNVEQDLNVCPFDRNDEDVEGVELNSNCHNTAKLSTTNHYNNHFHSSHQMSYAIPTINIHNNQQQQQQKQQQQNQQHHQTSSYEILNDNSTNVEALILQNQVDSLQWQLKQVETSCDMYRAVTEEVARFLERYQSQKQLQLHQQQQQMTAHNKHYNNNSKLEQIPRSKSLFQVYIAGGHEKSTADNNDLDDTTLKSTTATSTSYLRARSSTNLIDLKQQPLNTSCNGQSKDDHTFEPSLTPSHSYSAFKDFTWRRSPKKSDSRLNIAKDDVEEKLNQEAFRLLRTIQNLLNTSHHQPDLAHHRLSLGPAASLQMGRLSKAMSTTSVMTLPGQPILNSTSLTTVGANSNGCLTPDSSNISPTTTAATTTTANNAATNNLAPEMLFLRSANMRDSRLSLRSSTDSSVHSTSSAASSASSKVETDEEPSTPFHSPPNIPTHKQHHHLAGSSTEDESGFSSISSFPDIGVPLNSTLLSNTTPSGKSRLVGKELKSLKANKKDSQPTADSRNSTLKANVVGLPLNSPQDMSHRWDTPSKTYHNASNKFQKFSALTNEDSNTVLWV